MILLLAIAGQRTAAARCIQKKKCGGRSESSVIRNQPDLSSVLLHGLSKFDRNRHINCHQTAVINRRSLSGTERFMASEDKCARDRSPTCVDLQRAALSA